VSGSRGRRIARGEGYNLVVLAMLITVMSVFAAASIPVWSHAAQREREAELIFRGMQYAEAIRVFQARYGRPPARLEELVETSPRCIRQLWKDPMSEDGEWILVYGQAQPPRGRSRASRADPNALANADFSPGPAQREVFRISAKEAQTDTGLTGQRRQSGPIVGVHSASDEESIRSFDGATVYSEWVFGVERVPTPAVNPANGQISRANDRWVGRPFPEGVEPQSGSGPGGDGDKEEANPFSRNQKSRNPLDRNGGFGNRNRSRQGSGQTQ